MTETIFAVAVVVATIVILSILTERDKRAARRRVKEILQRTNQKAAIHEHWRRDGEGITVDHTEEA